MTDDLLRAGGERPPDPRAVGEEGAADTGAILANGRMDEVLVQQLVADHGQALFAFVLRATRDRQLAEDIVQETLFRAWKHPQAFIGDGSSPRGWLLTVARHLLAGHWSAQSRRRQVDQQVAVGESYGADQFEGALDRESVANALARLNPVHRDVLVEIIWRQHSVAETALALGIPQGTVKSRTYYALRSLRLILEEMEFWE